MKITYSRRPWSKSKDQANKDKHGVNASTVEASVRRVNRSRGDPMKLQAERERHYTMMKNLP